MFEKYKNDKIKLIIRLFNYLQYKKKFLNNNEKLKITLKNKMNELNNENYIDIDEEIKKNLFNSMTNLKTIIN